MMSERVLLECINLKKYFKSPRGQLHAVDDVSFRLNEGETLGVVGESGCGKSTLGRTILRLIPATNGEVIFDGESVLDKSKKDMMHLRKQMQIIFQDPYSSLDPKNTVAKAIEEPLIVHKLCVDRKARNRRVRELMDLTGLSQMFINAYPHELDGGRRQRIGIARALALNPRFIVCDEPVSALDVSIQAQVLNLMADLKDNLGLTYMFITHDLSVVKHISDRILVLYMGKMAELATPDELFSNPVHPYTKALLSAIPIPDISSKGKEAEVMKGEVTSPIEPKPGCRFSPRCPYAIDICSSVSPEFRETETGHFVACHIV
jgi:peptide/nickel transport system ATP-binding protein